MLLVILLQLILFSTGIIFPSLWTFCCIATSFSFVVFSFILWRKNKYIYNQYTFFGMIGCFLGDLVMASIIPLPNNLIGGIVVFSIAHILFMIGYFKTAKFNGKSLKSKMLIGLITYPVLMTLLWIFFIFNPLNIVLAFGALGYGLIVCIMAAFALTLYLTLGKSYLFAAIGSLIFVASDSMIGMTSIKGLVIPYSGTLIWITYVLALIGIIYSNSIIRGDYSGYTNKSKKVTSSK